MEDEEDYEEDFKLKSPTAIADDLPDSSLVEPGSPSIDRTEAMIRLIDLAKEEQTILKARQDYQALEKRLAAIRLENMTIDSSLSHFSTYVEAALQSVNRLFSQTQKSCSERW